MREYGKDAREVVRDRKQLSLDPSEIDARRRALIARLSTNPTTTGLDFVTVAECALLFRLDEKTIRRRIKSGALAIAPGTGRAIRIPVAEVRRMAGLPAAGNPAEVDAGSTGYPPLGQVG